MHLFATNAISIVDTTFNLLFFVSFFAIIMYVLTRTKLFNDFVMYEKKDVKSVLKLILLGGVMELLASEFGIPFPEGIMADIRVSIAMIFGIIGGPAVGIPVGVAGGLYRLSGLFWRGAHGTMGYEFALAGCIATIGAGVLGSVLYSRGVTAPTLRKNARKVLFVTLLWDFFILEIVCVFTAPFFSELNLMEAFYISNRAQLLPKLISDAFAILVFSVFFGGVVAEEEREARKLKKLLRRYEDFLGPEAQWIAREVEKDFEIERMIEKKPLQSKKKGRDRKGKGQK